MPPTAHIGAIKRDAVQRKGPRDKTQSSRRHRNGRKPLQTFVDDNIAIAFKIVAAENLTSDSALMHEAIGLLLRSYGKDIPPNLRTKLADEGLFDHFAAVTRLKPATPA